MENASLETLGKSHEEDVATHDETGTTKSPIKLKSPTAGDGTGKATRCKRHTAQAYKSKSRPKSKKKYKKAEQSSDSDSSDSSSSSSTSEESENSDASDSENEASNSDERKKKRRRVEAKVKRQKDAKKSRSKKQSLESSTDGSSDTEDEDESLANEKPGKKSAKAKSKTKAKAKKAAKQKAKEAAETREVAEGNSTESRLQAVEAQLARLGSSAATGEVGMAATPASKRRALLRARRGGLSNLASRDIDLDDVVTRKKSQKKNKRASRIAFKRVDQLWDSSIHNYKLTETVDDSDADEWDQYIFTVRRQFDFRNKFDACYVDLRSRPLKDALQHVLEDVKGLSLVQETPSLDPNMLFLFLEEIRTYMSQLKSAGKKEKKKKARKAAVLKAQHLKVLVKYLHEEFAKTEKALSPLLDNDMITFDLLWALYKPNTIVYTSTYNDNEQPRAFKVEHATLNKSFMNGTWYSVEGQYLDYSGARFGMGTMHADVSSFKGSRKITSLSCYPIMYHKNVEELKTKLIERGRMFVAFKGMNYRYHQGMAYMKKKRSVLKINVAGRVMIDPQIHRRINPNYQVSTVKPREDEEYFSLSDDSDDDSCGCCGGSSSSEHGEKDNHTRSDDEKPRKRFQVVEDENGDRHVVKINKSDDKNEDITVQKEKFDSLAHRSKEDFFTDEELLIASPVVLGFAFSEKLWLEFTVSGIRDLEWNEGAYDSLVLPENHKSIVKSLVTSHKFSAAKNIDDVISGKGKGLVAVLHGPPGTGKTLTAEGIAELLKCPLYTVSAGELGTDPRVLERSLTDILDIAHAWGAVLLLDEADVFLEKRSIHDIHRNALVSIFLRLLEYFQGILFLTTNRVETFDDAFQSRMLLFYILPNHPLYFLFYFTKAPCL